MKKWLVGRRFYSNEMFAETNPYFAVMPILLFGKDQQTGAALDKVCKA
jgi:hypothetical protein